MGSIHLNVLLSIIVIAGSATAQSPTGTITGFVTDSNGAAVPAARITITSRDNGLTRDLFTTTEGEFVATALPSGKYTVTAKAPGFRTLDYVATVEVGTTTTVNLTVEAGEVSAQVTIPNVAPLLSYESNQVGGDVNRAIRRDSRGKIEVDGLL